MWFLIGLILGAVLRVISNKFSSTRVVTEFHGKNQNAVYAKYLRLANSKEVETYLEKKSFIKSFFKKLFNQKNDN